MRNLGNHHGPQPLATLKVEKATTDGERRKIQADLGPVRYLATLLGANDEDVLRWFILVIALLRLPCCSCSRHHAADAPPRFGAILEPPGAPETGIAEQFEASPVGRPEEQRPDCHGRPREDHRRRPKGARASVVPHFEIAAS